MKTLAELQTYVQTEFNDTSTSIQTAIRLLAQTGCDEIAAKIAWEHELKSGTRTSVASQAAYNLFVDHVYLRSVKVTTGGQDYYPKPMASSRQWEVFQEGSNSVTSDIPEFYRVKNGTIELYPTPASSGNTITINYYGMTPRIVEADWSDNTGGTVAVTADATSVTGTSTAFLSTDAGRYLVVEGGDKFFYKISSYSSATSLTLDRAYEGSTVSGANFLIGTVPHFAIKHPEAMMILANFVLYHLWRKREQVTATAGTATHFLNMYEAKLNELIEKVNQKTESVGVAYIEEGDVRFDPNQNPTNLG